MGVFMPQRYHARQWPVVDVVDLVDGFFIPTYAWGKISIVRCSF